ncbi:hypothetical protein SBA6_1120014 [Candidatus Sulfopaludibacter sp. SbA6]|nr:hypothetical protein SBA6_1120014 [Candidatus Sulfopaludibacter sp. SbA6]
MSALKGKVAMVAGATRGAGRGIACMLGEAGATVYCSGRSTREHPAAAGFFIAAAAARASIPPPRASTPAVPKPSTRPPRW